MAEIKLTKTELRLQQNRLGQLRKYLPTLQLKKAMLQVQVNEARIEIVQLQDSLKKLHALIESYAELLSQPNGLDLSQAAKIKEINRRYENIAGVEVPFYESVVFDEFPYSLFDTPVWIDAAITGLRSGAEVHAKIEVVREKKSALEKELREVSIRVNLFEKILIPRAIKNIKKIKVFLGDQQLAAVSQAKVAKEKIIEKSKLAMEPAHAH